MDLYMLEKEITLMSNWWHKLIFMCASNEVGTMEIREKIATLNEDIYTVNLNLIISEALANISEEKYPLYVEEVIRETFDNPFKIYVLQHIDILFDPVIKINPIRLLENISKKSKVIVMWPGEYKNNQLVYAQEGHPECFLSGSFEGKVILI
ncbi:TPA: BREX-3 system P-loop-containing protein BrxF [Bacillus cereus]|nr:BREX-3 system P-loop-containing protein BrxF [Bacillus cereus]